MRQRGSSLEHRCCTMGPRRSSPRRTIPAALAALLLALGSACPERNPAPPASQAPCTQFGQRCEVSPGKLGTCVKRDDCSGDDCYLCQSQH